jgi:hypothetical protein
VLHLIYFSDYGTDVKAEIKDLADGNPSGLFKRLLADSLDDEKRHNLVLGVGKSEYLVSIPVKYHKTIPMRTFSLEEAQKTAKPQKWFIEEMKYIINNYDVELTDEEWSVKNSDYSGIFTSKLKVKKAFSFPRDSVIYYSNAIFYCLYLSDYKLNLYFLHNKTNSLKHILREFDLKKFEDLQFLVENFQQD